jgi:hypothetical protein
VIATHGGWANCAQSARAQQIGQQSSAIVAQVVWWMWMELAALFMVCGPPSTHKESAAMLVSLTLAEFAVEMDFTKTGTAHAAR